MKDYTPYGPEWEKEMMKFSKAELVTWIRKNVEKISDVEDRLAAHQRREEGVMSTLSEKYICSCGADYTSKDGVEYCQENHGKPDYRYESDVEDRLAAVEKERDDLKELVDELRDFAIWMTGCGYDFCQHEYFCKKRDRLLRGKDTTPNAELPDTPNAG